VSPEHDRMSDADLITAVRGGDTEAYGVLYERHLHAAKRAASCLANSQAEREDLVADAFTKVLRVLRDGRGPEEEFRAYLLVTMRNAAISGHRGATVSLYADVPETYLPRAGGGDPVLRRWDASIAATAFASLPERWRTVLWHTEVEGESPAEIATLLGMRPNGVAALAYRAREGLRQAYLRAHLREVESRECKATVSKLAGWVRRSVPTPLGHKISRHLSVCADCRARADTLTSVNEELRASIAPVLLGAAFAAAYVPAAAPVSGAAGMVAVKTVLAKVGVAAAIAATAVTTVASAPSIAGSTPGSNIPVLADPITSEDTIEGPGGTGTGQGSDSPALPDTEAPATTTTAVPVSPGADPGPEAVDAPETAPATPTAGTKVENKAEKEAAKAEKKAEKAEDKAEKKEEKAEEKAERKAEKQAEKGK
jgi:RNA polymerase sigma factor (sigma-70 family)